MAADTAPIPTSATATCMPTAGSVHRYEEPATASRVSGIDGHSGPRLPTRCLFPRTSATRAMCVIKQPTPAAPHWAAKTLSAKPEKPKPGWPVRSPRPCQPSVTRHARGRSQQVQLAEGPWRARPRASRRRNNRPSALPGTAPKRRRTSRSFPARAWSARPAQPGRQPNTMRAGRMTGKRPGKIHGPQTGRGPKVTARQRIRGL